MTTNQIIKIKKSIHTLISFGVVLSIVVSHPALAVEPSDNSKPISANSQKRFIFSWPITDDPALTPRGGSTRGPAGQSHFETCCKNT